MPNGFISRQSLNTPHIFFTNLLEKMAMLGTMKYIALNYEINYKSYRSKCQYKRIAREKGIDASQSLYVDIHSLQDPQLDGNERLYDQNHHSEHCSEP